jgi:ATP-binding cassette subfamily B multidrug efflux pump
MRAPPADRAGAAHQIHVPTGTRECSLPFKRFEALVPSFPEAEPRPLPKTFFAFLWENTRGMRGLLLVLTLLTAVIGAFEALLFSIMAHVVDLLAATPPAELWAREGGKLIAFGALLLISVAVSGTWALLKYQALFANFPMRMRWVFHRLMLGQSMSFYQDEFAGRIATKVMQTALAVRDVWFLFADIMTYVVVYFVTIVAVVGSFDLRVMAPFGIWLVLYVVACRHFVPRLAAVAKDQADARSLMTGRITDAYTNIATVKLFSHAQREAAFARDAMDEFLQTAYRQGRLVTSFETLNQGLSMLLVGGTTALLLWLWTRGEVGVGAIAASTAMALRLSGMSHWVMWELASLFEHVGTVQDGLGMLSRPNVVVDRPGARELTVRHGEIRFEHVDFSYGGTKKVIDDFNLVIKPGEKIGLVGRSGAGKSTIVNLLLRLYDVQGGRILIDGQDIAGVTQDSLRRQVGMVTQDTSLLHRSVRDNIVYGRPGAGDAEMLRAAERAEAHDFIVGLTDPKGRKGYDAHVGERGVKLSGGQRQRIAIARVMLKDAPILLLDEATSALDSEVEAAIQASLYKLMEGKTVVAIAHRLSTIMAMDRLVVMEHGRIVEMGDHASLLAAGGIYARLWAHQSGGFLGDEPDDEPQAALAG